MCLGLMNESIKNSLNLKCVISALLAPPNAIAKIMILIFKRASRTLMLVDAVFTLQKKNKFDSFFV